MPSSTSVTRAPRRIAVALAALGLVTVVASVAPVPAAHAESGYRVCGYYTKMANGAITVAFLTKINRGSGGEETCKKKLAFINKSLNSPREWLQSSWDMATCEDVGKALNMPFTQTKGVPYLTYQVDPCVGLTTNTIYRFQPDWTVPTGVRPKKTLYHR